MSFTYVQLARLAIARAGINQESEDLIMGYLGTPNKDKYKTYMSTHVIPLVDNPVYEVRCIEDLRGNICPCAECYWLCMSGGELNWCTARHVRDESTQYINYDRYMSIMKQYDEWTTEPVYVPNVMSVVPCGPQVHRFAFGTTGPLHDIYDTIHYKADLCQDINHVDPSCSVRENVEYLHQFYNTDDWEQYMYGHDWDPNFMYHYPNRYPSLSFQIGLEDD